jgi:O-acetyl-ADP-ribose deacetylase (regulator of RNase III)
MTKGYRLPARFILHAVGPVWQGGGANEAELLASCYRKALALAVRHELKSVAFPAISTGIYRYPKDEAAKIAVATAQAHQPTLPERIVFCCFDTETAGLYRKLLA